jgi:hypothetical protein
MKPWACGCVALGGASIERLHVWQWPSAWRPSTPWSLLQLGGSWIASAWWACPVGGFVVVSGSRLGRSASWPLASWLVGPALQPTLHTAPIPLRPVPLVCCVGGSSHCSASVPSLSRLSMVDRRCCVLRRRLGLRLPWFLWIGFRCCVGLLLVVGGFRFWLAFFGVASACVCLPWSLWIGFLCWFRRCVGVDRLVDRLFMLVGSVGCWSWVGGWSLGSTSTASLWRPFQWAAFDVGAPLSLCVSWSLGSAWHFPLALLSFWSVGCWSLGSGCCWSLNSAWVVGRWAWRCPWL